MLDTVLQALAEPGDPGRFRAALATPLLGYDAAGIAALDDDSRALGDVVESEPLVGVDHDLERFLDRGCAVVVLDREARAIDRGDVGLAIEIVLRDVDLVVGEPVAQVDHPLPRVRREDAVRPLLDQLVEGIEGAAHVAQPQA